MDNKNYAYILVADEKYWNRLCDHNRAGKQIHAFVRKNQVAPKNAQKILFYVKKPAMQIRGHADFIKRTIGDAEELWEKYGKETCFKDYEEYHKFLQGRQKATFVLFQNFAELATPQPKEITSAILGSLRWFRGKYLNNDKMQQLTV